MEQIKSNEVRLGNWVNFKSVMGGNENRPLKITINDLVEMANPAWEHCYTRIPLTEEILLKMGFEAAGDNNTFQRLLKSKLFKNGEHRMIVDDLGVCRYNTWGLSSVAVQYVHSFQNLIFAITGTELEFEL